MSDQPRRSRRKLDESEKQNLLAQIHRGVPNAHLEFGEELDIHIEGETGDDRPGAADPSAAPENMRISLDSLNVNIHNQSFGMISASTGCISNPGGPSC
jgi:hypothetical protein